MTFIVIGLLIVVIVALGTLVALLIYDKKHSGPPLLDPTIDALLIVREDEVIEFASHRAEEIFGWPSGAMVGMLLNDLIPPRFHKVHHEHMKHYFSSESDKSYKMGRDSHGNLRRKIIACYSDGTEFPVMIELAPAPNIGDKQGAIALIRDMSTHESIIST